MIFDVDFIMGTERLSQSFVFFESTAFRPNVYMNKILEFLPVL